MIYRTVFNLVFRRLDPERAHHIAMVMFHLVQFIPGFNWLLSRTLGRDTREGQVGAASSLPGRAGGRLRTANVLGVAAGFDKNAEVITALSALGYGFVEIGTVTAKPQPGNDRPRLWRLLAQRGLRNRMGFNNDGASQVARRLQRLRRSRRGRDAVVGVNIGKSKVTLPAQAAADYAASAALLGPYADYVVVNVSSPNTPGLRDLQSVEMLRPILQATARALTSVCHKAPPLLVKIAPDLADADIDAVADLVIELGLAGVVAVNTTIAHDLGEGGLSGPVLRPRGVAVIARLRARLGPEPLLIGVGGIETEADACAYLAAGANYVQAYTAFIYHGPAWPGRIARALIPS